MIFVAAIKFHSKNIRIIVIGDCSDVGRCNSFVFHFTPLYVSQSYLYRSSLRCCLIRQMHDLHFEIFPTYSMQTLGI